jgi:hypothetical protein
MLLSLTGAGRCQSAEPVGKQYRPFAATIKTTYINERGGEKQFSEWFFRRSNGSYAHIKHTEGYDDERGIDRYVANTEERSFAYMTSFTRTRIVFFPEEQKFRGYLEEPGTCGGLTDGTWKRIGESERLGIHVMEVEDKWSETLSTRRSVAPELECFSLLDVHIEKGVVRTIREVLSVQFGEPDPGAFRSPQEYVDVSPLEFEELWKGKYNGRRYYGNDEQALRTQYEYQAGRARSKRPAVK